MVRTSHRATSLLLTSLLLAARVARAEDAAPATPPPTDSLPGDSVPSGLGLSPEAPPVPPAPGGRAPSFAAPTPPSASSFRLGGRFFGWETVGIGRKPSNPPEGYSGTALHSPALSTGKIPFWGGAGASLNMQYGTPVISAYVGYYFRVSAPEYQGYLNSGNGPAFGTAYLLVNPSAIGVLKLNFKLGAITENYAGPGQWGWGIYGPLLAVRGFGETTNGEWDLTRNVRASFNHGFLVVPGVDKGAVRGDYVGWIETGTTSYVHHAHVGLAYKQYAFRLHYASAYGVDERVSPQLNFLREAPVDGRMDTYLAEARWQGDIWGQAAVSGGLYDFTHAAAVGNGVWWAVDWTQGSREMVNKYLGEGSHGTGKVAVVGAEYNFSVSRILWAPRSFTGQAPDVRVAIAGMLVRTLDTPDPALKGANGYFFGVDTEYRMSSLFSLTFQTYGESRGGNYGRWSVYSANPGIAYHSNWLTTDRIQIIYSRRYYSTAADPNTAQPLDRDMIAFGGYVTF